MENASSVASRGSLAWPGNLELLAIYGDSATKIGPALIDIIKETQRKIQERVEEHKKSSSSRLITGCEIGHKVVIANINKNIKKIPCAYCQEEQEHSTIYTIRNAKTDKAFLMEDILFHLFDKHSDLGTITLETYQILEIE